MPAKTQKPDKTRTPAALPATFQGLVGELVPAVIHGEVAHRNALDMLRRIMRAGKLNAEQAQYGELLGHLIADYARLKSPEPNVTGLDCLIGMMEQHEMNASDIARLLNVSPSLVSRVLKGERTLTWNHARVLAQRFGIKPEMLMESAD